MGFFYSFFSLNAYSKYTAITFQQKYMTAVGIDREVDGHTQIVRKTKHKNFYGEEWKELPRVLQP